MRWPAHTFTCTCDSAFRRGDRTRRGPRAAAAPRPGHAPLATRARPATLAEFVGQEHLLSPGSALRRAIEEGKPHSMIFHGPPGSGKTTLARIVAAEANAAIEEESAVAAGRAEVRAVIERARQRVRHRRGDDLLPRRDPPLQQGPAGRAAAGGRGGPDHADRRDDREPVLRGQLGAAVAGAASTSSTRSAPPTSGCCSNARSRAASAARTSRSSRRRSSSSPSAPAATPAPR